MVKIRVRVRIKVRARAKVIIRIRVLTTAPFRLIIQFLGFTLKSPGEFWLRLGLRLG